MLFVVFFFFLRSFRRILLPRSTDVLNSWFVFYSAFLPLLSCIHVVIDVVLFLFAELNPICTLTVSFLLSVGWIIQISFWCHCDYSPDSDTCYQYYVMGNAHSHVSGSLIGVSDELTAAKVILGVILLVL